MKYAILLIAILTLTACTGQATQQLTAVDDSAAKPIPRDVQIKEPTTADASNTEFDFFYPYAVSQQGRSGMRHDIIKVVLGVTSDTPGNVDMSFRCMKWYEGDGFPLFRADTWVMGALQEGGNIYANGPYGASFYSRLPGEIDKMSVGCYARVTEPEYIIQSFTLNEQEHTFPIVNQITPIIDSNTGKLKIYVDVTNEVGDMTQLWIDSRTVGRVYETGFRENIGTSFKRWIETDFDFETGNELELNLYVRTTSYDMTTAWYGFYETVQMQDPQARPVPNPIPVISSGTLSIEKAQEEMEALESMDKEFLEYLQIE